MSTYLPWDENGLKVQYFGQSGYTVTCLQAIDAILSSGVLPERATIVTHVYNRESRPQQEEHLFIFWNWKYVPIVVIPSGFASGYPGEGPKGFALAICMIRSKGIPIDGIDVNKSEFDAIDQGQIYDLDNPLFLKIKAKSETLTFPWSLWVPDEYERLLEKGQLWRALYWRETKADWLIEAISDIDLCHRGVGKKLRMARDKLEDSQEIAEWQNAGLLIRDAWIELARMLCQVEQIDMLGIKKDKVIDMLRALKLEDKILDLAKASFDLSLKTHHDRNIRYDIANACVISTIVSMHILIQKYLSAQ